MKFKLRQHKLRGLYARTSLYLFFLNIIDEKLSNWLFLKKAFKLLIKYYGKPILKPIKKINAAISKMSIVEVNYVVGVQ